MLEGHVTHYTFFKVLQIVGNINSIKRVG
jgi:hypothetical protein